MKGKYGGQIRPKTGAPGIFPEDLEADFALFLKHCQFLRIPRSKIQFKEDIRHYVEYNDLDFPKMQDEGPGEIKIPVNLYLNRQPSFR